MDPKQLPMEEIKALGDRIRNPEVPIGGGYQSSAEVKSIPGSAYTQLSREDQAVIDRQTDRLLRNAQEVRTGDGALASEDDRSRALMLTQSEMAGNQKDYVERFVNNSRASFSDPKTLSDLKRMAASQQERSKGVAR